MTSVLRRARIYCDPGVDDAAAMAYLAAGGISMEVVATAGNVSRCSARSNADWVLRSLGLMGLCSEGRGPEEVAMSAAQRERLQVVHGHTGLGGLSDFATSRTADAYDRPSVGRAFSKASTASLALSPLTSALADFLSVQASTPELAWMGGCGNAKGRWCGAEFNAWCDPAAANRLVEAGILTRVIPSDVTGAVGFVSCKPRHTNAASGLPRGAIWAVTEGRHRHQGSLHDLVAAVLFNRPELAEWSASTVRFNESPKKRGVMHVQKGGEVLIATDIDLSGIQEELESVVDVKLECVEVCT